MNKQTEALKLALEKVQEFKARWWKVPPFGNKVNKATREAITNAHSPIFELENTIREALAEQPAQQQEPVALLNAISAEPTEMIHKWRVMEIIQSTPPQGIYYTSPPAKQQEPITGETNVELGFYTNDASNGQQRKLVSAVEVGQLVGNRTNESASNLDPEGAIAVITGIDEHGPMLGWYGHWINYPVGTKFYTSPQPSKPLTMQERTSIVRANKSFHDKNEIDAYGIIDDVEAAHGIKGDA